MTIRFGPYPVPFHGGLDARSDPKNVVPPFLRDLRDAVYLSPNALDKRPGSRRLRSEDLDGAELPAARAMATRGDELVRFSDALVHTYDESIDRWAERGALESITPTLRTIAFAPAVQRNAMVATASGVTVYVWEDSRSSDSVRYAIYDEATGAALLADTELAADGTQPRVIAIGAAIYVYYWTSGTLYKKTILTGDVPGSIDTAAASVAVNGHASAIVWDLYQSGSGGYIAYRSDGPALVVRKIDSSGGLTGTTVTIAEDPARGISIAPNADADRLYIGWLTTAKARFALYTANDLVEAVAPADHATSADLYEITAEWDGDGVCHAFWEERPSGATAANARVYKKQVSTAGAQTGALDIRHSGLASGAFRETDTVYVMLVFESTLQSTYFLYRDDLTLLGKALPDEAEGLHDKRWLGRPVVSGRVVSWMAPFKRKLETDSFLFELVTTGTTPPAQYADLGLKRLDLDFGDGASHRVAEIGKSLYVSGMQLWQYDGGPCPVECGFHLYPENVTNPSTAAGSIPAGTYAYRVFKGWTNDKGEVEISSTAQTLSVTLGGSLKVTIRIPTDSHTLKQGSRERMFFIVTRSKIDPFQQSPLYRVSSSNPSDTGDNGWIWNTQSADYVDFVDNLTDAVIANKERDYLSAGELDHVAPPVGGIIAAGKDRLYVAGFEDGNKIVASLLHFDGQGLAFNENLEIDVDSAGGPITGLEVMDDRLIVFKRDRAFVVVGDGPSNTGQGAWEVPQRVTGDVGCIDQRSLAQAPIGVVFQSAKGIRLMDRNLAVSYLGSRVTLYNDQTITSAVALVDDDLLVFMTDDEDGRALVYNYDLKVWTTWTRYAALDATLWQDQLVRATPDGRVLVLDEDLSTDDGESYGMVVEFPHLQPGGPQGFVQIQRALFLGHRHSAHKLRCSVCYDMEPTYVALEDFDPDAEAGISSWGSDDFWGAEKAWGGMQSGIEHFEASMPRQKCFAFGLKLEEIPSSTPGRAFTLVGLVCAVAGQPGVYRLREAVRVAASRGGGGGPGGGPRRST